MQYCSLAVRSWIERGGNLPHNNLLNIRPFLRKSTATLRYHLPLALTPFREYHASFRILFCAIQADRTEKRNDLLEKGEKKQRERERRLTHTYIQCNSEKFANRSSYECFPMARYLRARHEYLLQKKVLTRALLLARRRSSRSYAKAIREQSTRKGTAHARGRRETLNKRDSRAGRRKMKLESSAG